MKLRYLLVGMLCLLTLCTLCACAEKPSEQETIPTPKNLTWAIGTGLPQAEDFFDALPQGVSVSFAEVSQVTSLKEGNNSVSISYRNEKGKETVLTAVLCLIEDTQPPVISGVKDLIVYLGEGVSYRSGITYTDNCGGKLELLVDSSAVDVSKEGDYPVVYYVTDLAGNTASAQATVHVYMEKITEEMLYAEVDLFIAELGLNGLTKEAQIKLIYSFVHTNAGIVYTNHSDKASWIREAYICLRDRRGDCFSFFAVSKAFFERLGIENKDIQRSKGYTEDTHYWSLVNLADAGAAAEWYHYDATRVRDISYSAALLTDRQVQAFSRMRSYFYIYDTTAYPASATVEKIARPDLEPYYQN